MKQAIVKRLRAWYNAASAEHRREGRAWYSNAARTINDIARQNSVPVSTVAGMIAATSPRLHWKRNVEVVECMFNGWAVTGVFGANVEKAYRIMVGERPLDVLGGLKVRAFYRALMGQKDASVIDVWMMRAAGLSPDAKLTPTLYTLVSDALVTLAHELRRRVAEVQAVIWVALRGRWL